MDHEASSPLKEIVSEFDKTIPIDRHIVKGWCDSIPYRSSHRRAAPVKVLPNCQRLLIRLLVCFCAKNLMRNVPLPRSI